MHAHRHPTTTSHPHRVRLATALVAGSGAAIIALAGARLEGEGIPGAADLARCALSGAITAALALLLIPTSTAPTGRQLARTSSVLTAALLLAAVMALLDLAGATIGLP